MTASWRLDGELSNIHSLKTRASGKRRSSPILRARAPPWAGAGEISSKVLGESLILKT